MMRPVDFDSPHGAVVAMLAPLIVIVLGEWKRNVIIQFVKRYIIVRFQIEKRGLHIRLVQHESVDCGIIPRFRDGYLPSTTFTTADKLIALPVWSCHGQIFVPNFRVKERRRVHDPVHEC